MKFSFFRSVSIALAMLSFLLFGMVKNSEGFEITSMSVENGASGCYVSLTADEDILWIDWYIDNEHVHHSMYSAGTRSVYENIGYLSGSPFGKSYTIKAKAVHWNENGEEHVSESDPYDVYAYSTPKTKTKYGGWTMATMYGSVDVGWNGTTAEATAYGSIEDNMGGLPIVYGIRIEYVVGTLTPLGFLEAQIDVPDDLVLKNGTIRKNDNLLEPSASKPYTDSVTVGRGGGGAGKTFFVEAAVSITAQNQGRDPNEIDELFVWDRELLTLPRD